MDIHVEGTPGVSSYSYICSNVNPLQIDIIDLIEALIIILTEAVKHIFRQSFFKAKIAFVFVYKFNAKSLRQDLSPVAYKVEDYLNKYSLCQKLK